MRERTKKINPDQADSNFIKLKKIQYLKSFIKIPGAEFGNELWDILTELCPVTTRERAEILLRLLEDSAGEDREDREDRRKRILRMGRGSFCREMEEIWETGGKNRELAECARKFLARAAQKAGGSSGSVLSSRLAEVRKIFGFRDIEVETLTAFYMIDNGYLDSAIFKIAHSRRACQAPGKIDAVAGILGRTRAEISAVLDGGAPLRRYGMMDDDIDITRHISNYLTGISKDSLCDSMFRVFKGRAVDLGKHGSLASAHAPVIEALVRGKTPERGVNILFYGKPGTGKTEFARSLARSLGRTIYEVQLNTEEPRGSKSRNAAFLACVRLADPAKSVIVIDEADGMLNTRSGGFFAFFGDIIGDSGKGKINDLLDTHSQVCVWITNRHSGIDESTRRRFDYAVKFNALSLEKRLHIWLSAAERRGVAGLLPQETLERLAADYEVDAGGVDIVLRNLRSALSAPGLQSPESAARQLLRTHCGVMEIPAEKPAAPGGPGDYSLEGLSVKCPVPLDKITAGLKKFHAALRDGPAAGAARNICVLLHGPPGTGKTEFAKHIARETGAKLIIKNASDLLDAFVGGTEARIKAAFDEAEEERAILFMDEADSILRDRAGAFRSWEVSQTNELLGGMERFRGIMICATNFERSLDLASLRRFSVKIEFDYLSPGGALLFYKRVLPGIASQEGLSPEEERRLRSLSKLTPGDFKVVAQKFSLWSDGGAPHSELLDALEAETEMRSGRLSKKVGF